MLEQELINHLYTRLLSVLECCTKNLPGKPRAEMPASCEIIGHHSHWSITATPTAAKVIQTALGAKGMTTRNRQEGDGIETFQITIPIGQEYIFRLDDALKTMNKHMGARGKKAR